MSDGIAARRRDAWRHYIRIAAAIQPGQGKFTTKNTKDTKRAPRRFPQSISLVLLVFLVVKIGAQDAAA